MSIRNPNCEKCPLHVKAQHVCMAGRGTVTGSPVVFVGQAPGKDEDEKGLPFVGPSGQLLQQMIDENDLRPAFFTNAVRCFPGQNAKGQDTPPTAGQIAACAPYLEKELATMKPRVIVAVGGHALQALTGKTGITTYAGQVAGEYKGTKVFAILHPNYIFKKKTELPRFEAHAKELAGLLRPGQVKSHPPVREASIEVATGWLRRQKVVAWDIETSTKWPWQGGHIRTVSFSDGKTTYWVNGEARPELFEKFLTWFLRSEILKDAQNLAFESLWSLWLYGIMPKNWRHDTMLMAHLVDENGPKALDLLASTHLGAPGWDIVPRARDEGWVDSEGEVDFGAIPIPELGPYNGLDSAYTEQLIEPLWAKMNAGQKQCYEQIMLPLAKLCARMELRGMHFNPEWAKRAVIRYTAEMERLDRKMRATPLVQKLAKELAAKKNEINWRSPKQRARLLFGLMKLPVTETTDSGQPSTQAEFLERIPNPPALLTDLLAWQARDTVIGKYLDKLPKFMDEDHLIHAQISPARIVSGRTAVSNPPLHGTPEGVVTAGKSDGLVRGAFDSRFEGGLILSSDYKALEFRLVCSEANEKAFIDAFVGGMDPHAVTATDLFGPKFTPDDRARAKITNFSIIYGVTEYSLAPKLSVSQEEALRIILKFKKAHPGIFVYMARQFEMARTKKMVVNRFGRVRHLPDIAGLSEWKQNEILREAGNFPIQSLGADITNLAAIEVDRKMRLMGLESKLVLIYHDALVVDTHPNELHPVKALLVKVMSEEIPGRLDWLKLPLAVDVKEGPNWAGKKWPEK